MSLRDWFAGMIMAGMLANPDRDYGLTDAAHEAYAGADAMLAERVKCKDEEP